MQHQLLALLTWPLQEEVRCGGVMSKDILDFAGLRLDGRRANEIRKMQCDVGVREQADGSACVEQGNTKIIATVYGPREVTSPHLQPSIGRQCIERQSLPRGRRDSHCNRCRARRRLTRLEQYSASTTTRRRSPPARGSGKAAARGARCARRS